MNRLVTFSLVPVTFGLLIAVWTLTHFGDLSIKPWLWCLVILAAVVMMMVIASLLNIAVFTPIYWLLGKRRFKRRQNHEEKT